MDEADKLCTVNSVTPVGAGSQLNHESFVDYLGVLDGKNPSCCGDVEEPHSSNQSSDLKSVRA